MRNCIKNQERIIEKMIEKEYHLEKQKLVIRSASKNDRRINLVSLTNTARELQNQTIELANQTMDEALVGVTKSEIETVKTVLQKVYDNLSS